MIVSLWNHRALIAKHSTHRDFLQTAAMRLWEGLAATRLGKLSKIRVATVPGAS